MSNSALANIIANALGNEHFDADQVICALKEKADEMSKAGKNPGSLIAIANLLPQLAEEAKKRY